MTDPNKKEPSSEGSAASDPTFADSSSWSGSEPSDAAAPEFDDSTYDYDATASASLSETPLAPEPGAVFGTPGTGPGWDTYSGMGNGPGWSNQPTYPSNTGPIDVGALGGQPQYAQPAGAYGYPGPYGVQTDPAAPFGRHGVTGEPLSEKSKVTAGLLQILLGFVGICGVGRLYIGSTGIGLAQMLLVFFGYLLILVLIGFLIVPVVWLWAFVDGIMMLTGSVRDSNGRRLRD